MVPSWVAYGDFLELKDAGPCDISTNFVSVHSLVQVRQNDAVMRPRVLKGELCRRDNPYATPQRSSIAVELAYR